MDRHASTSIYLDHAATTPLDGRVLEAMMPYLQGDFGNASSAHAYGQAAMHALDRARASIGACLGVGASGADMRAGACVCEAKDAGQGIQDKNAAAMGARTYAGAPSGEVYFTAGGTESDNWAIRGVAYAARRRGNKIVTSAIEHHAVLHTCRALQAEGFEVVYVPVLPSGVVDMDAMQEAVDERTTLVSVMHANNETGVIQPIRAIAQLAHRQGAWFHTDAVQTVGAMPVDVVECEVDLLSLSAHKFYGPKGVGALYVRRGVGLDPILYGGAQERGLRPGTYNVPAIVGMAEALRLAVDEMSARRNYVTWLRDRFEVLVHAALPDVVTVGKGAERLVGHADLCFAGATGTALLYGLDREGIAASAGSACTAGAIEPSHVLLAMGMSEKQAAACVRFTFGRHNTLSDVERTVDVLARLMGARRGE